MDPPGGVSYAPLIAGSPNPAILGILILWRAVFCKRWFVFEMFRFKSPIFGQYAKFGIICVLFVFPPAMFWLLLRNYIDLDNLYFDIFFSVAKVFVKFCHFRTFFWQKIHALRFRSCLYIYNYIYIYLLLNLDYVPRITNSFGLLLLLLYYIIQQFWQSRSPTKCRSW